MLVGIISVFAQMDQPIGLDFLDGHAYFHSPETSASDGLADKRKSNKK